MHAVFFEGLSILNGFKFSTMKKAANIARVKTSYFLFTVSDIRREDVNRKKVQVLVSVPTPLKHLFHSKDITFLPYTTPDSSTCHVIMVDRVAQNNSHVPISKAEASPCLLPNGTDIVAPLSTAESSDLDTGISHNGQNGTHSEPEALVECANTSKVPKAVVPKDLLIDKGGVSKGKNEKGFDTFLMTGDMMIKTNPSLKLQKLDGSAIERHHSDSTEYEECVEKKTVKRSASSPDQATLTGATKISHENVTMDGISTAFDNNDDDSFINRKESAESGFDEQAVHSDSGVSEKKDKITNDPTSVSDLSEVDSDDFLGNMVSSQTSTKCGTVSTVSTPSDLRSDISVNTVLQQEVEPLLHDDSSSSSSIDISSSGSGAEDMSPEMIFERSLSDSGGMSPVYQKDIKSLLASKSAEKIVFQRQIKLVNVEHQSVRASKSQENYVGDDITFVSIDIDDQAYSLDQIPQPVDPTPTNEEFRLLSGSAVSSSVQPSDAHDKNKVTNPNDERIFMPAFVKLNESVHSTESSDKSEGDSVPENNWELTENSEKDTAQIPQEDDIDHGAQPVNGENLDIKVPVINQEELFALPPAKSVDQPSAKRLAKRLYNLDGFRKSDVSRHLCKK